MKKNDELSKISSRRLAFFYQNHKPLCNEETKKAKQNFEKEYLYPQNYKNEYESER